MPVVCPLSVCLPPLFFLFHLNGRFVVNRCYFDFYALICRSTKIISDGYHK